MGRRKGSKNKKKRSTGGASSKKKTIGLDFIGGILIVLGFIFIVFFTFENIGVFSNAMNNLFLGLFGVARFALPLVLIYVGIFTIISEKAISITSEIIKGIVMMVCVSSCIYIFSYGRVDMFENFTSFVSDAYVGGNSGTNSYGVIGALIGNTLYKINGLAVARIIIIAITFFFTLYFLNIGLRQLIAYIFNMFAAIFEFIANACVKVFGEDPEKKAKLEEQREERARRREALKEEREAKRQEELLKDKGNPNYKDKIKEDWTEQLLIDLDGKDKVAEEKAKAKEQRDEYFRKQKETNEEKNVKEVLQLDHSTHEEDDENYIFPPLGLLQDGVATKKDKGSSKQNQRNTAIKLQKTLASFGVEAKVTNITEGPTVVRYELSPAPGVKVSKIVNLSDDIALNLAAKSIRIEAPIPGKGTVGIEIPNESKETVFLKDVIASREFEEASSKLTFGIGRDAAGDIALGDIAKMPHVLIAGATGSGKSVCINTLLVSILYKAKPNEVKLILIDPKMVELSGYNGIPHLLLPVVTDPKKAAGALNWAVNEMIDRYTKFASKNVKDIKGYNKVMESEEEGKKLPQIVIVIDELSDLMMAAPNDVEDAICRLAQMARAAGMYLVIATQRPSVDVITGVIKANIPSRIAFTVSSQIDSRTILDMAGAEKLLGKGDMLYYPTGQLKPERMQGAFVSESEVENIVTFIKGKHTVKYREDIIESVNKGGGKKEEGESTEQDDDADILLDPVIEMVVDMGQASASMIQRRFKVGATRAGRIVDQMEERGIVSGYEGSKPRHVLITKEEWQEIKMSREQARLAESEANKAGLHED